jgi:hypothetical protein
MERGSAVPAGSGTEDRMASSERGDDYRESDRSDERESKRTAEPYRPRMSFGERVRAFFRGRESAGY